MLSSCSTVSNHQFAAPSNDWQTRNGQLLYRAPQRTLIGEVIVRTSKSGDLELTFSKGGLTLLTLRQDATTAEMKGALAGPGWAGPVANAPGKLRGWLGLREKLLQAGSARTVQHAAGSETFILHF